MLKKVGLVAVIIISVVAVYLGYVQFTHPDKPVIQFGSETRQLMPIYNATTTSGIGNIMFVEGYQNVVCAWDVDLSSTTVLLQFRASIQDTAPNFFLAASSTNQYDNIEIVDLQNGNTIDGDTGVSVSSATDHRLFEVNTNLLTWLTASTSISSGTSTLYCKPGTNK